jgi:tetratricopeptide (TPR) repeat protein
MTYQTLSETEWEAVERVWDLLDEGRIEDARAEVNGLLERRPGHPDLRIADAAVALDEGEAGHALIALQGAQSSADPSLFFHLRAAAHYELAELEAARDDADRALAVNPEIAETHALLARTLEYLGDAKTADAHAEIAHEIDAERFPPPL